VQRPKNTACQDETYFVLCSTIKCKVVWWFSSRHFVNTKPLFCRLQINQFEQNKSTANRQNSTATSHSTAKCYHFTGLEKHTHRNVMPTTIHDQSLRVGRCSSWGICLSWLLYLLKPLLISHITMPSFVQLDNQTRHRNWCSGSMAFVKAVRNGTTMCRMMMWATIPFRYCPSMAFHTVWPHCTNARRIRRQEDLNSFSLEN